MMRTTLGLAAFAPLALTACGTPPEEAAIDRNAALIENSLERRAAALEAIADNAADPDQAGALDAAADRLEANRDNIADAAHAAKADLAR